MVEEVEAAAILVGGAISAAVVAILAGAMSVVLAISLVSPGIVSLVIASHNIKERTSRGTRIVSGTEDSSFLQIPSGMIIHTTGIMTTMLATIPMDNPHHRIHAFPGANF